MSVYAQQEEQLLEFPNEVTCGSSCGHFDSFNQCCWLSWWHKNEGDHCDYGLVEIDGEIYTPKELEELRNSRETEPEVKK